MHNLFFDLDIGVKVTQNLRSTIYSMLPIQVQRLKLV